jgi:hypothetical protein
MIRRAITFIAWVLLLAPTAAAATEQHRIDSAIEAVEQSPLKFIRGDRECDGKAAAEHLRGKLERRKDHVKTFDQFIEQVATRSAMSGKPYLVKLPDDKTLPLSKWLRDHDAAQWGK